MLSAAQASAGRRSGQSQPSLKQQYQEYLLQRIEGYKNSLPRAELLGLGDEAAAELQNDTRGQFVLTEILMLETVDRIITKRLGLGSYARWKQKFVRLRSAQQEPTHWGIDPQHAIVSILHRLESDDRVLAIGSGAEPFTYLLSAFDAEITFVAGSLGAVERVETRIATEALGNRFQGFVAQLGEWLPPLDPVCLAVIDASAVAELTAERRRRLFADLQMGTCPEGVHLILPGEGGVAPEGYLSHYPSWERIPTPPTERGSRGSASRGLMLTFSGVKRTQVSTPEDTSVANSR